MTTLFVDEEQFEELKNRVEKLENLINVIVKSLSQNEEKNDQTVKNTVKYDIFDVCDVAFRVCKHWYEQEGRNCICRGYTKSVKRDKIKPYLMDKNEFAFVADWSIETFHQVGDVFKTIDVGGIGKPQKIKPGNQTEGKKDELYIKPEITYEEFRRRLDDIRGKRMQELV